MKSAKLPPVLGREVRRVHCAGIGGMGVGPLAIYLARLGFEVSGEDDALTPEMAELLGKAGVRVGPMGEDCELAVYSSAIAATHPVQRAAAARGLPLVRRGEMLAEVVRGKKLVAVCGSHGKTTTTAMLITALRAAKFPAGYVLGGLFADESAPAEAGANEWVVAEIDESDGTIARFGPEITVAVNLDWDHPDHYRTREDLERTFAELFARTRGAVLVNEACETSERLCAARARAAVPPDLTFGRNGDFAGEIAAEEAGRMRLRLGGKFRLTEAEVRAGGEFNASNAMAALAAAQLMGAAVSDAALAEYAGVRRRQAVLWAREGTTVIEDYAHHPAEIRALLASLRRRVQGSGRLIVVFQPHRYSRTKQFKAEFAEALAAGDRVFLLDVYGAGEAPIEGGTTADVFAAMKRTAAGSAAERVRDEALSARLSGEVRAGDWVAFVGAGDIDRKARAWIETLERAR